MTPACGSPTRWCWKARRRGVIVRPLGDTLIMLPPLTISDAELEILVNVVRDSIQQVTEAS